jgi:hypothetical protein
MVLFPMIHAQTSQNGIFSSTQKTMLWQQPDARKKLIGFEGPCPDDTPLGSLSSCVSYPIYGKCGKCGNYPNLSWT